MGKGYDDNGEHIKGKWNGGIDDEYAGFLG